MSQVIRNGASGMSGGSAQGGDFNGSSKGVRTKYRKGDRTRRLWTAREEEILAASLKELTAHGWKSDNGFQSGYPHVVSRIFAWKNNFNSLRLMLSRTGVGFNPEGTHKIDCNDEQWAQIVAADRNARFMRHKAWPLWEECNVIFGKDRASGTICEDIADGTAAVRKENAARYEAHNDDPSNDYRVNLEDLFEQPINPPVSTPDSHHSESTGQSEQRETTPPMTMKKCKQPVSSDAALLEFLGQMHNDTNKRLDEISSRIGYEFDLGQARQAIHHKLGGVAGLTGDQRYELCDILADRPQRLEVFMGMAEDARPGYVLRLLGQNPKPA